MSTQTAMAGARSVGHLFEFRTMEMDVPAGAVAEVESAAAAVARHARHHEPGTRLFAVLRDRERPGHFICTAVFDDEEAVRAHRSSPAALRLAAILLAAGADPRAISWTAVAGI